MIVRCAWCGADLARTPAPDPDCGACGGTGKLEILLACGRVPYACTCIGTVVSHGLCDACEAKLSGAEVA